MTILRVHVVPNAKIDDVFARGAKRANGIGDEGMERVLKAVGLR